MTIQHATGDMWERFGEPDTIMVLAANCAGVMGAGQVKPYPERDPHGYIYYRTLCRQGKIRLGEVTIVGDNGIPSLIFPTMFHPGGRSQYTVIEDGARDWVRKIGDWDPNQTWLVPMLGCGIGGLDPERVTAILTEHLAPIEGHTFVLYAPRPGGAL